MVNLSLAPKVLKMQFIQLAFLTTLRKLDTLRGHLKTKEKNQDMSLHFPGDTHIYLSVYTLGCVQRVFTLLTAMTQSIDLFNSTKLLLLLVFSISVLRGMTSLRSSKTQQQGTALCSISF